ncbi:MAG: hypothetical protein K2X66_09575 [Cyanobacteria bacterium]|nr:hypothetical protein [Cyanobacteriota bacterium]
MSENDEFKDLGFYGKPSKPSRGSLTEGFVWGLRGHLAFTILFVFFFPIYMAASSPGFSYGNVLDFKSISGILSVYCYTLSFLQIVYMLPMILIFAKKKKLDSLLGTLLLWMCGIILFMGSGFTLCTLSYSGGI